MIWFKIKLPSTHYLKKQPACSHVEIHRENKHLNQRLKSRRPKLSKRRG
jgi:hypothetical protein